MRSLQRIKSAPHHCAATFRIHLTGASRSIAIYLYIFFDIPIRFLLYMLSLEIGHLNLHMWNVEAQAVEDDVHWRNTITLIWPHRKAPKIKDHHIFTWCFLNATCTYQIPTCRKDSVCQSHFQLLTIGSGYHSSGLLQYLFVPSICVLLLPSGDLGACPSNLNFHVDSYTSFAHVLSQTPVYQSHVCLHQQLFETCQRLAFFSLVFLLSFPVSLHSSLSSLAVLPLRLLLVERWDLDLHDSRHQQKSPVCAALF